MTRNSQILTGLLSVGILLASNGCAMLTAKTVGTFVATEVGKKAIKDIKEDHDQKKAAEQQQQANSQSDAP